MKKPNWQYFELEEYQQRLDALRGRMEGLGVDAVLVNTPENLYYLSGYQTPGYYWWQTLVVPMDREPVSITRRVEDSNMRELGWVEDRRPYEDYEDWVEKTRDVLVDLGLGGKTIGMELGSFFLPARDYLKLQSLMPGTKFVDSTGLIEEGRMIKSPQEIEYMRQAAKAAEAATLAGIEAVGLGATENDVAAEMHRAQIKAGSEYTGLADFRGLGGAVYDDARDLVPQAPARKRSRVLRGAWVREPLSRRHDEGSVYRGAVGVDGEGDGCGDRHPKEGQGEDQAGGRGGRPFRRDQGDAGLGRPWSEAGASGGVLDRHSLRARLG